MGAIYEAILLLYPRTLREEYGIEMTRVLREMADDPTVSRYRLWMAVFGDLANGLASGAWTGSLFGGAVLAVWYVGRSQHHITGLALIALLLLAAGFAGARRSGSVLGGIWSGFVAGCVSALTLLGDSVIFGLRITDAWSLTLTVLVAGAAVMIIVVFGALLAGIGRHQLRVRRSVRAFVDAWARPA